MNETAVPPEPLTYLLECGLPAPVVESMLHLADDWSTNNLRDALDAWEEAVTPDTVFDCQHSFSGVVEYVTHQYPKNCADCELLMTSDDMHSVENDGDHWVCDDCLERYSECEDCSGYFRHLSRIDGNRVCEHCADYNYSYCEYCDAYYHNEGDHDWDHEDERGMCDCEAVHLEFAFPADGHGTIAQDERLAVELPAGTIDDIGMATIQRKLLSELEPVPGFGWIWHSDAGGLVSILREVGPVWQTKAGNFTRRLSSAVYKAHKAKLPAALISEVGNLARAHSSGEATWQVEVTRDLNQSASYFLHTGSCWFTGGDYASSRCCLKSWGGLALRTFETAEDHRAEPNGRAWVQPLGANLKPTHDTLNAHAYIVFNGYGKLEGYIPARIVAHMAGMSYRKIRYTAEDQYVNNRAGYLVADEATCVATESIEFELDCHDVRDARSFDMLANMKGRVAS